ncbi:60S acidic ribosomal protein P0 [Candida tropicalis MYA-3404]|uniref:60S acidic ribosomal protein P0 n=1 Tax=Candida tropicalis (strain ATCC MYA-3404 / T1) TaxID=294747 RepID=C5MFP3_CANTT|nr:60S acidic ribosomal protein P0 [Candida tropicalis MYA-3404]EER31155.1 60S acidic ribosomal protein P0 [Candida tropicalis MYA-3404]KAG4404720.1 hypothetical protein JTP64_005734 [Candida tropicalis]
MFNMFNKVASDGPTLASCSTTLTSETISMVPSAILVGTPKAWKKEVLPGSIPVLPAGIQTSFGAMAPASAGAATTLETTVSLIVFKSPLVKMKPTLPLTNGNNFSNSGNSDKKPSMALSTMVFLPIKTTASPLKAFSISCICWEETLSTPTTKIDLYSSNNSLNLVKY